MDSVEKKVGRCLICQQGELEIVKDKESRELYICCDECEAEWRNPEDAIHARNGSRNCFGPFEYPTMIEIESIGWEKYINK